MKTLLTIGIIIVLAGLLGGIVNYYMNNETKKIIRYDFFKSIIFGIAASFTVPLLLKMMSSNLIIEAQSNHTNYFVFGGFCLVASIFSTKFLQSIADKILSELKEVKKGTNSNKQTVDILVSQKADNTEKEEINMKTFDDDTKKIIDLLQDTTKYSFRSIDAINRETDISRDRIKQILHKLLIDSIVVKHENGSNKIFWSIKS